MSLILRVRRQARSGLFTCICFAVFAVASFAHESFTSGGYYTLSRKGETETMVVGSGGVYLEIGEKRYNYDSTLGVYRRNVGEDAWETLDFWFCSCGQLHVNKEAPLVKETWDVDNLDGSDVDPQVM